MTYIQLFGTLVRVITLASVAMREGDYNTLHISREACRPTVVC